MKTHRTALFVSVGVLIASVMPTVVTAQTVTTFVSASELRERIELWRKARESYYTIYYANSLRVNIADDSREVLVAGYRDREIPSDFVKLDKNVIRAVVYLDLETTLARALTEKIRADYQAVPFFIASLLDRKIKEIVITLDAVRRALAAQDCGIIPCDPKMCRADQCSQNSFRRFLPPKL